MAEGSDYLPRWIPFSEIQAERVEWVVPGVPRGMLTLLAGMPKMGKSLLTCRWAAELSYGGESSVLVSAEDSPSHVTKARLTALEAKQELVHYSPGFVVGNGAMVPLAERLLAYKPSLIVLDPFTAMMPGDVSSWNDQHVRSILAPLAEIAEQLQCAIVYVLHLNKRSTSGSLLERIGGSIGFSGAARSILGLTKDDTSPTQRLLGHICNVAEADPTRVYEVQPMLIPGGKGQPDIATARMHFAGISDREADNMFAPSEEEETSDIETCKELIRDLLLLGETPSSEIESMLRANGISKRTEERARRELGVKATQRNRRWMLYLA